MAFSKFGRESPQPFAAIMPDEDFELGVSEQSGSKTLKVIDLEDKEQRLQLLRTEAKLKSAEVQLKETQHQLVEAEAKNVEIQQQRRIDTIEKEEMQKKLKQLHHQVAKYKHEVEDYKIRLAEAERKNEQLNRE